MAFPSEPRVVFKNTTKISLNERFTEMLTNKQPVRITIQQKAREQQDLPSSSNSTSSTGRSFQHATDSETPEEVEEMEVYTSAEETQTVKAVRMHKVQGKRNVHSRLGWPYQSQAKRAAGAWKGSWGRDAPHGESCGGGEFSRAAGTQREMQGGWVSRPHRRWVPRETQSPQSRSALSHGNVRKYGARRGFGWRGSSGYKEETTGGYREHGSSRGRRGRESFGDGSHRRRHAASRALLTKEELDDQLDAYMSASRGRLDAELQAYMTQINDDSNM